MTEAAPRLLGHTVSRGLGHGTMAPKKSEAAGGKRKAAEEANGHIQGACVWSCLITVVGWLVGCLSS